MRVEVLSWLHCPRCLEPLEVEKVLRQDGEELVHAIVRCSCHEYPVAQGILVLNRVASHAYIAEYLVRAIRSSDARRVEHAVAACCHRNSHDLLRFLGAAESRGGALAEALSRHVVMRAVGRRFERAFDPATSYFDVTEGPYFRYRFSSDSFWSVWAGLPVFRPECETLVDVGCGHGHASHLISKLVRPKTHFCVDRELSFLFLARRYFAPRAQAIALDLGGPMPFADRSMDAVFTMDALHYVQELRSATLELERILGDGARMLGLHFHNGLVENPSPGEPLPWDLWARHFERLSSRVLPESALIQDFLDGRPFDLERRFEAGACAEANAIAIVAARSEAELSSISPADWTPLDVPGRWSINPLYEVARSGERLQLTRRSTPDFYQRENPVTWKHLPERTELPSALWDPIARHPEAPLRERPADQHEELDRLVRRGILLPLPSQYVGAAGHQR